MPCDRITNTVWVAPINPIPSHAAAFQSQKREPTPSRLADMRLDCNPQEDAFCRCSQSPVACSQSPCSHHLEPRDWTRTMKSVMEACMNRIGLIALSCLTLGVFTSAAPGPDATTV